MSTDDLYLITAATGKTGANAVRILREDGQRVRALVHSHDARAEALAGLGAEIVTGDLLDFASVSSALAGVTAAYFCYPIVPGLLDATAIFAQAATEAGVTAVVNMSQVSARRDAKSHAAQNHWLGERLLDRSAFATAHLRPTFFAEWLAWQWSRDDDGGVFRLPFADGRHAPIAAVVGFPVRYEPVDIDTFADVLRVEAHGDYFVQHITNVAQDYRDGIFAGTNNLVEVITGTPALTVEQFAATNRDAFTTAGQAPAWAKVRA